MKQPPPSWPCSEQSKQGAPLARCPNGAAKLPGTELRLLQSVSFPKAHRVISAGKASADTLPLERCKHLCMTETPVKTFSRAPGSQVGNRPRGKLSKQLEVMQQRNFWEL